MNQYETLLHDIVEQTKTGQIQWTRIPRRVNAELSVNPTGVFPEFSAQFAKGDDIFTLLLREKTYGPAHSEHLSGNYVPEVLIVDNGEVLVSLSDWLVPRADLIGLMRLVDTTTPNVNKLSKLFA